MPVTAAIVLVVAIAGLATWYFFPKHRANIAGSNSPLQNSSSQDGRVLSGGHSSMASVVFSPDGKLVGAIADEKTIYLLHPASGKVVQQITDACCTVTSIAISPDNRRLAIGMNDGSGARIRVLVERGGKFEDILHDMPAPGNVVYSIAFSGDGQEVLTEIDGNAIVWDLATAAEKRSIVAGVSGVCALSPEGIMITAGSNENEVKLWDLTGETPAAILIGHTAGVLAVAITADALTAASGGYDSTVRLWDVSTRTLRKSLKHGEQNSITTLSFSHSGLALATASTVVRIWDVASGAQQRTIDRDGINSLAFSPDDQTLAGTSKDGELYLWPLR